MAPKLDDVTTGYGLMGLTWRANSTPDAQAFEAMKAALAGGATLWSTAEFYGMPEPTEGLALVRRYFEKYPEDAPKVTLFVKGCADLKTLYPTVTRDAVHASAQNCLDVLGGAKTLDIFGPARLVPGVLDETLGALVDLVAEGKIGAVGLSEVSAATIERAHAAVPLALVEDEFSLWTRDVLGNGVLATTRRLGIPLVAYSPIGRGFLTGQIKSAADIPAGDIRNFLDRFQPEAFQKNQGLITELSKFAAAKGVTPAQLALAWVRAHSKSRVAGTVIPIPGATKASRVQENTEPVALSASEKSQLDDLVGSFSVQGLRYNAQLEGTLWA